MKNRKVQQVDGCSRTSTADFRVMARLRDGSLALVSLARNSREAAAIAKRFRDEVDRRRLQMLGRSGTRRSRPGRTKTWAFSQRSTRDAPSGAFNVAAVLVQVWDDGWQPLAVSRGGFIHVFRTGPTRDSKTELHSGAVVLCCLLQEQTRKGGWRARLSCNGQEGPITNSADMPDSACPGEEVLLRIGTISADRKRIQFHWMPNLKQDQSAL